MGTCRPWELGPRKGSFCLTCRFIFGGRGRTVRVPFWVLLLLPLLVWLGFGQWNSYQHAEGLRQAEMVDELQAKNEQLQAILAHKEREREQMVALAESRSAELWRELEIRDKELEELWSLVGVQRQATRTQPKGKPERAEALETTSATTSASKRRSLMASRSGNSLAVKMRYRQLIGRFQEKDRELESLGEAARAFRQKKYEEYRRELASRTPTLWPCQGQLSSGFGSRIHPVYGYGRHHAGCDITAPIGTPIVAAAAGVVVTSDWMGGYGMTVEIDHGNGLTTLYAHCSELLVPAGTRVSKGQLIARVGSTGVSTGPHLHYEVKVGGQQVDPAPYLKEKEAPRPVAKS